VEIVPTIESCGGAVEVYRRAEEGEIGSCPELHPPRVSGRDESVPPAYDARKIAGADRKLGVALNVEARAEGILRIVVDDRKDRRV
jgi:hypothetical protein